MSYLTQAGRVHTNMLGEHLAPQGPQAILLIGRPDLDAEASDALRNISRRLEVGGLRILSSRSVGR